MKLYEVIKTFKDIGNVTKISGDIIELDEARAAKLLQYRLIGILTNSKKEEIEQIEIEQEQQEVEETLEIEQKKTNGRTTRSKNKNIKKQEKEVI